MGFFYLNKERENKWRSRSIGWDNSDFGRVFNVIWYRLRVLRRL